MRSTSGTVRADPAGPAGRGIVDPRAGGSTSGAPAHGAAGVGQCGPAAAEGVPTAGASGDRPVRRGHRRLAARGQEAPRKQRHTARRVWQRLVAEHGATLSEVTVSRYVARRKVELGLDRVEVVVPQTHPPGAEAEVDFGEFYATHRRDVDEAVDVRDAAVALGTGVPRRVRHPGPGGVPGRARAGVRALRRGAGRIRYDNLKPAVVRVLRGRDRTESERFIALRSHYGFESFFCRPGKDGAHEKGGVEGEIGRFRRRHLVPVPNGRRRWPTLNELIAAADVLDDARVITGRPVTVGAAFAAETARVVAAAGRAVRPGPAAGGPGRQPGPGRRCGSATTPSRPATPGAGFAVRLIGHHRRGPRRAPDRSPPTSGPSAATSRSSPWTTTWRSSRPSPARCPARPRWPRPRRMGAFTAIAPGYWDAVRRARGDAAGTRALIEVLLAHRTLPAARVDRRDGPGRRPAGCLDPQVVLIDARREADTARCAGHPDRRAGPLRPARHRP